MTFTPPVIDDRSEPGVLQSLDDRAPGFTPEWKRASGSPDDAVARVFARYAGLYLEGLRQTPSRGFAAFLDMLGASLLPAEPARVPLVFTLMGNATQDPSLVANSQVAAPAQPPAPSPLLASQTPSGSSDPVVFSTEKEITLARATLAALYSIDPGSDTFTDHSALLTSGFTFFDTGLQTQVGHILYLGHDSLFALAADAEVKLSIQLAPFTPGTLRQLDVQWEYLSEDGWLPLSLGDDPGDIARNDSTTGFTQSGQIVLTKNCGPDAAQDTVNGIQSYWIRGRLTSPLLPETGGTSPVAVVDTILASVSFVKDRLLLEAAATDGFTLDTSTNFFPFGRQPQRYTTFYLASKEVFQRQGALVRIDFTFSEPGVTGTVAPQLAWEYFNGTTWQSIQGSRFLDGTFNFHQNGPVTFLCPTDWTQTSVAGTTNYWLRVRLDSGDYGHPLRLTVTGTGASTTVKADPDNLNPPVISGVQLQYSYQTDSVPLNHCLAFNDFVFSDYTHQSQWPRLTFKPFSPVEEQQPAVHYGFDQQLPSGLVSIFLQTPSASASEGNTGTPMFVWEYLNVAGWSELGVLDETTGFSITGMIQFVGQPDAVAADGLGGNLFRIRARLKEGEALTPTPVSGIWMNAAWATNSVIAMREQVGFSDGSPSQIFYFRPRTSVTLGSSASGSATIQGTPIINSKPIQLPAQAVQISGDPLNTLTIEVPSGTVEVREWNGHGADWQTAAQGVPADQVRTERNPSTREVTEVWIQWQSMPHLLNSSPQDRHFVIERALGSIRFGDGIHGRIPTSGNKIVATYATGGGLAGNVPAGAITQLQSAVPFLNSVSNPVPATGGAATEALDAVMLRGPEGFRNGGRAVSPRDIEWVARDASPGVARARCLPVTGPIGRVQRGWFTVALLPLTSDAQPVPSPELMRVVLEHLAGCVPASVVGRILVVAPNYVPVNVIAELVPLVPDQSAQVEALSLQQLDAFLHPLTGGPDGTGWPFGEPLHFSQIAAVLSGTTGVDYVISITLQVGDSLFDEIVPVSHDSLIASGVHEVKLTLAES